MQSARRLYVYFVTGVSLFALALGVINLIALVLNRLFDSADSILVTDPDEARRRLSLWGAVTIVSLPIWLLHWTLAQRGYRSDTDGSERSSVVRALYLTAGLTISTIVALVGAAKVIERFVRWSVDATTGFHINQSIGMSLAMLLIGSAVWVYHIHLRRQDLQGPELHEEADYLPRIYLYGVCFVGLGMLAYAVGDLFTVVINAFNTDGGLLGNNESVKTALASAVSRAVIAVPMWLGAWMLSIRLANDSGWVGRNERASYIRRAYIYLVCLAAVVLTMVYLTRFGGGALSALLGVREPDRSLGNSILEPALRAVPFIGIWLYHRAVVLRGSLDSSEDQRQLGVRRIYVYALTAIGVGLFLIAMPQFLGGGLVRAFGDSGSVLDYTNDDTEIRRLASLGVMSVLGGVVALWHWAQAQRLRQRRPEIESQSGARRTYLYGVLAVTIVTLLVNLALVLFYIFSEFMGVNNENDLLRQLANLIGFLIVAGGLFAYHLQELLRDMRIRPAGTKDEPEPALPRTRRIIVSLPPSADADAIAQQIRSLVPDDADVQLGDP